MGSPRLLDFDGHREPVHRASEVGDAAADMDAAVEAVVSKAKRAYGRLAAVLRGNLQAARLDGSAERVLAEARPLLASYSLPPAFGHAVRGVAGPSPFMSLPAELKFGEADLADLRKSMQVAA